MKYNEYEGKLGSVRKAEKHANRMNAIVERMRSAGGPIPTRELRGLAPNPNYYLNILRAYGIISCEDRMEETISVKEHFTTFCHMDEEPQDIKVNEDGTVTYLRDRWTNTWHTLHDAQMVKAPYRRNSTRVRIELEGMFDVQVKRRYWVWKV